MRKNVEDNGHALSVKSRPDDAAAILRRSQKGIAARVALNQPQLLTNTERDLLLIAIAQALGILT